MNYYYKLQDCGLTVHEKCRDSVPKTCSKYKSVPRDPTSDQLDQQAGQPGEASAGHDSLGGYNYAGQEEEQGNITMQVSHYNRIYNRQCAHYRPLYQTMEHAPWSKKRTIVSTLNRMVCWTPQKNFHLKKS